MKNLKLLLFIPLFFLNEALSAQSSDPLWIRHAEGPHEEVPLDVFGDASGNILTAGVFSSEYMLIDGDSLANACGVNLTDDAFITKHDNSGNLLWSKRAGGPDVDLARCISTDASGNVLVAGVFYSPSISFGSVTLFRSGTSNTIPDIFLVKYDALGNVLWAKKAGGTSLDYVNGLCVDLSGNIFMTGYFRGNSISFGTASLTNNSLLYTDDAFLVKYSSAGTVVWAKRFGGGYYDYGNDVVCDASGNILLTGSFSGNVIVGVDTLEASGANAYIAQYSTTGNMMWLQTSDGPGDEYGNKVCVDNNGDILLAGTFRSEDIHIGSDSLLSANENSEDVFLAKYNSFGNPLWLKGIVGSGSELLQGLCSGPTGTIHLSGSFGSDMLYIANQTIENTSAPEKDAFLLSFDPAGNLVQKSSSNVSGNEQYMSVFPASGGDLILCGYFNGVSFSSGPFELDNSGTIGTADVFLLKVSEITGTSEIAAESSQMDLFPNPSQGLFSLLSEQSVLKIEVLDLLGKAVLTMQTAGSDILQLDLTQQPNGFYLVRVYTEKEMLTQKICVSK